MAKQIRTRIAGFNHHAGAPAALTGMRPQTRLVLKPEPANPYDKNAIAIYTTGGLMLGFVPAVDNKLVLEKLGEDGVRVRCVKTSDTFNSIALIIEHEHERDPLS
jgi:hypothetical protein